MRALPLLVLGACVPPEAPTELDELASFLFVHAADRDDRALEAGLHNLDAWLAAHMEETSEGYAVTNPSTDAIDSLGGAPGDGTRLVGAAVGAELPEPPERVAPLLTTISPQRIFPGSYTCYDRTPDEDAACFAEADCARTTQRNVSQGKYTLGLKIAQRNRAELRWVELDTGSAIVHRTWLTEPARVTPRLFDVPAQLYLNVVLPHEDGHRRLQATWIEARLLGDAAVPEGIALQLVLGSMKAGAQAVEDWYAGAIDEGEALPSCDEVLGE